MELAVQQMKIIMVRKEGTLQDLICSKHFIKHDGIADPVASHILQALDYLSCKDIIHRDVKPANILYTTLPDGRYHFQLSDCGLCNIVSEAITFVGSPAFMAPEVQLNERTLQTAKADVWSLFTTLADTFDANGYRQKDSKTDELKFRAIMEAAETIRLSRSGRWPSLIRFREPQLLRWY